MPSPILRSSWRLAGSCAQPASWPCVVATSRRAPARRSAGAIRPSGAAAPNHTDEQPCSRSSAAALRVTRGVGTIIFVRSLTTGNGCSASNRATSVPSRQVEA